MTRYVESSARPGATLMPSPTSPKRTRDHQSHNTDPRRFHNFNLVVLVGTVVPEHRYVNTDPSVSLGRRALFVEIDGHLALNLPRGGILAHRLPFGIGAWTFSGYWGLEFGFVRRPLNLFSPPAFHSI